MKKLWNHLLEENHKLHEGIRYMSKHGIELTDEAKEGIKNFNIEDFIIKHSNTICLIIAALLIGVGLGGYPVQYEANHALNQMHEAYMEVCGGLMFNDKYIQEIGILENISKTQVNWSFINQSPNQSDAYG